jgi:hypothetical protein
MYKVNAIFLNLAHSNVDPIEAFFDSCKNSSKELKYGYALAFLEDTSTLASWHIAFVCITSYGRLIPAKYRHYMALGQMNSSMSDMGGKRGDQDCYSRLRLGKSNIVDIESCIAACRTKSTIS